MGSGLAVLMEHLTSKTDQHCDTEPNTMAPSKRGQSLVRVRNGHHGMLWDL